MKAKRYVLLLAGLILLTNSTSAAPKPGSNVKSVARVVSFPVRHPLSTAKGFFYGVVKSVGAAVDLVERGTAALHMGVNKVDETIDKLEDEAEPPKPATPAVNVPQRSSGLDEQPVDIPGCAAKAFVPKGCYSQTVAQIVEVRCPGQTFTFRCLEKP